MRFADIENIWASELSKLSNADKGRVYFERAKQVVADALADPEKRAHAVSGKRFSRSYLVKKIGCQPAVSTQNIKIRALLADIDAKLEREAVVPSWSRGLPGRPSGEVIELRATIDTLNRRLEIANIEVAELRRKLGIVES